MKKTKKSSPKKSENLKVTSHLKGDIKTFKQEIKEDKSLIKSLKKKRK